MNEAVDYVKTELMPDFNFDAFNHDDIADGEMDGEVTVSETAAAEVETVTAEAETTESNNGSATSEEVDKW